MTPREQEPTRVRYDVMVYLCALAFILYIDRICIGQAGTASAKKHSESTWTASGDEPKSDIQPWSTR